MIPNQSSKKLERADFGTRLVAVIIDALVLMALAIAVGAIGLGKVYERLDFLVGAVYAIYFWVNRGGATVGKQVMKIKVVNEKGKTLSYGEAILRYLGYIVSAIPLGLGFLWVIWDDKKQGFHDKIAKTYVVKE